MAANIRKWQGKAKREFNQGLVISDDPKASRNLTNVFLANEDGVPKVISAKGKQLLQSLNLGEGVSLLDCFEYIKTNGQHILVVQDSNFYIHYSSNLADWNILEPLNAEGNAISFTAEVSFANFEDVLWITNGVEDVVIFDGTNSWVLDGGTYTSGAVPNNMSLPYQTPYVVKAKHITGYLDRIWLGNTGNEQSETVFSRFFDDNGNDINAYHKDAWVAENQILIAPEDGQVIQAMIPFQGSLVIFKDRSKYSIDGTSPSNFSRQKIDNYGTVFGKTVRILGNVCLFLSDEGVYSYYNRSSRKVSDSIQTFFDKMSLGDSNTYKILISGTSEFNNGTVHNLDTSNDSIRNKVVSDFTDNDSGDNINTSTMQLIAKPEPNLQFDLTNMQELLDAAENDFNKRHFTVDADGVLCLQQFYESASMGERPVTLAPSKLKNPNGDIWIPIILETDGGSYSRHIFQTRWKWYDGQTQTWELPRITVQNDNITYHSSERYEIMPPNGYVNNNGSMVWWDNITRIKVRYPFFVYKGELFNGVPDFFANNNNRAYDYEPGFTMDLFGIMNKASVSYYNLNNFSNLRVRTYARPVFSDGTVGDSVGTQHFLNGTFRPGMSYLGYNYSAQSSGYSDSNFRLIANKHIQYLESDLNVDNYSTDSSVVGNPRYVFDMNNAFASNPNPAIGMSTTCGRKMQNTLSLHLPKTDHSFILKIDQLAKYGNTAQVYVIKPDGTRQNLTQGNLYNAIIGNDQLLKLQIDMTVPEDSIPRPSVPFSPKDALGILKASSISNSNATMVSYLDTQGIENPYGYFFVGVDSYNNPDSDLIIKVSAVDNIDDPEGSEVVTGIGGAMDLDTGITDKKRYLRIEFFYNIEIKNNMPSYKYPTFYTLINGVWYSAVYEGFAQENLFKMIYSELVKFSSSIRLFYRVSDNDIESATWNDWNEIPSNILINEEAKKIQFKVIMSHNTFDINNRPALYSIGVYYGKEGAILSRPSAFIFEDKYILTCCDTEIDLNNNTLLIMNTNGQWVKHLEHNLNAFCWYYSQCYAVSAIDDKIWNMFVGVNNDEKAIKSIVETEAMYFEYPDNEKRLRFMWINALMPTTRELEIGYAVDGGEMRKVTVQIEAQPSTANHRFVFPTHVQGKEFKFFFGNSKLNQEFKFNGFEIYFDILPRRQLPGSIDAPIDTKPTRIRHIGELPRFVPVGWIVFNEQYNGEMEYMGNGYWKTLVGCEWANNPKHGIDFYIADDSVGFNTTIQDDVKYMRGGWLPKHLNNVPDWFDISGLTLTFDTSKVFGPEMATEIYYIETLQAIVKIWQNGTWLLQTFVMPSDRKYFTKHTNRQDSVINEFYKVTTVW